jgi:5-(carboxyamino)imidazole ribonucleotide synthase
MAFETEETQQTHSPSKLRQENHGPCVGIIGGGQLSRMLCIAAAQLGIRTVTVERKANCPAAAVSHLHQVGDWNDPAVLRQLAAHADVVTLENEFVNAETLTILETENVRILPSAECLRTIQDKLIQKEALQTAGLPTPRFRSTDSIDELQEAGSEFGYPFVLKRRRNGYDGKGNFTIKTALELETGWAVLNGDNHPLFAEEFCPFKAEIAVMVCRSSIGQTVVYPVVETIQKEHICHIVKAPAAVPDSTSAQAIRIATDAVSSVKGIGSIGVELFLTQDDQIVVNELAPRVHNSGHYTIEACHTSQFENHIRAVLGLPLGNPGLIEPAAVMINLLGDAAGPSYPSGVSEALEIDGAHLHLYGKDQSQLGRKMGHLTVTGNSMESVMSRAESAARKITFA